MSEHDIIDQHAQDLLNGGVDGELSAAEQKELLELLAESGEARQVNKELKSFVQLMAEIPELDPPKYLQESIERQVRLPLYNKVSGQRRGFFGTWLSANWLRTSLALAAGVVLTVGVYEMGSEPLSERDAATLVGTVVKNQVVERGELLDRIDISNDTLLGLVELRKRDDLFVLDLQLSSDSPTEVVVNFAGRGLDFESAAGMHDRNDAVTLRDGSVIVAGTGEQRYTLNLRRNADMMGQQTAPLELEFFINNSLVQEAELSFSRQ